MNYWGHWRRNRRGQKGGTAPGRGVACWGEGGAPDRPALGAVVQPATVGRPGRGRSKLYRRSWLSFLQCSPLWCFSFLCELFVQVVTVSLLEFVCFNHFCKRFYTFRWAFCHTIKRQKFWQLSPRLFCGRFYLHESWALPAYVLRHDDP